MDGFLDWYLLGVALGLGVAAGIPGCRAGRALLRGRVVLVVAVVTGVIAALWLPSGPCLRDARRGRDRRLLVPQARAGGRAGGVARRRRARGFVPIVGYLEAVLAPILGDRLRRRASGRYAGLRVLAKD